MTLFRSIICLTSAFALAACSYNGDAMFTSDYARAPKVSETTETFELLKTLPAPQSPVAVAVYSFDDQTGQFKSNDKITEYSSAVTKGGLAILNNALLAAGNRQWFRVVERGGLKNVLQERQIIRAMNEEYRRPDGSQAMALKPLFYAGMIIEGGIIGYDTNTLTGGAGANYFGIGGNTQYRSDTVSVYLRAVNVKTGEVLLSTTSTKTIYSFALQGNIFHYLTYNHLLQAETGFSLNEPVHLAVRQAVEAGVYGMIMEGAMNGLWGFADPAAGERAVQVYLDRKAEEAAHLPENAAAEDLRVQQAATPAPQPVAPQPVAPQPVQPAAPLLLTPPADEAFAPPPAVLPAPPQAMAPPPPPVPAAPVMHARPLMPPPPPPVSAAPEATIREPLPKEPMPRPEMRAAAPAPAPAGATQIDRPADPRALIKYLDAPRAAGAAAPSTRPCTGPYDQDCVR